MSTNLNRLKQIEKRVLALGWRFYWLHDILRICQGHIHHDYPIRDKAVLPSYDGKPDVHGTKVSLQAAERLLSPYEDGPTVVIEHYISRGGNKRVRVIWNMPAVRKNIIEGGYPEEHPLPGKYTLTTAEDDE